MRCAAVVLACAYALLISRNVCHSHRFAVDTFHVVHFLARKCVAATEEGATCVVFGDTADMEYTGAEAAEAMSSAWKEGCLDSWHSLGETTWVSLGFISAWATATVRCVPCHLPTETSPLTFIRSFWVNSTSRLGACGIDNCCVRCLCTTTVIGVHLC